MSDALAPGDIVTLEDEDSGPLPVFDNSDAAVNRMDWGDIAFVVGMIAPPLDLPSDYDYPLLLLPHGPMGWVLEPHMLRKL